MTAHLIFHLGTYKTGSSSIQNGLFYNAEALQQNGILYPQTGLIRNPDVGHRHRAGISDFMEGRRRSYAEPDLLQEITTSGCNTAIMSAEAWAHPNHLALLAGMVQETRELGFADISGVVFLRRLVDYKVSHYREFTLRNGNRVPYLRYAVQGSGMFDYLYLARQYRAAFGPRMHFLPFDPDNDSFAAFLGCLGLGDLMAQLKPVPRLNIKTTGALGIEVMRHCNRAGMKPDEGQAFLDTFEAENPGLFSGQWTERQDGDMLEYTPGWLNEFAGLTGWDRDQVDALFADTPITGRHVSGAEREITAALARRKNRKAPSS